MAILFLIWSSNVETLAKATVEWLYGNMRLSGIGLIVERASHSLHIGLAFIILRAQGRCWSGPSCGYKGIITVFLRGTYTGIDQKT